MTTREVFDRHLAHLLSGDLDAILSDYAPAAITADSENIGTGHEHIRKSYERVLPSFEGLEMTTSVQVQGEVLYLTYSAGRDGRDEVCGSDTFVIRDDLIHVHTFYAHHPALSEDDDR